MALALQAGKMKGLGEASACHPTPRTPRMAAGEMKALKKPPPGIEDVTAVVLCLLEGAPKDKSWGAFIKWVGGRGLGFSSVTFFVAEGSDQPPFLRRAPH